MTSTEESPRKRVAKEIAEDAEALAQQANSTAQQVLAELQDLKNSSAPAGGGASDDATRRKIVELEGDLDKLVEQLNGFAASVKAPMGPDGQPIDLSALVVEIQKTFAAHAKKIDDNNEAVRKAVTSLTARLDEGQTHGDPAANSSLQQLRSELDELAGLVKMFDEAGVAPASAEDVESLRNRLATVERYLNADGPVAAEYGAASPSNAPPGVPAIHRQVWQLMNSVAAIGKDSQADKSMGGYKFRSIEAAMTAVGRALREVGVMFVPGKILDKRIERYSTEGHEWKNGTKYAKTLNWTHVWVTQQYYFVSLIDGSKSEPFEMDGEARDNGDKSTSKADSMRMKYALLQALCIPTEGLPESDGRDGTEGADWGSAPAVGNGQGSRNAPPADDPWADAPPIDDAPQYQPGDAQHARSGAAQQQPMAPQQPVDNRTDEEKAAAAVKALRDLNSVPPDQRRERFLRIARSVQAQHLGQMLVDGITVTRHLSAANGTLVGSG